HVHWKVSGRRRRMAPLRRMSLEGRRTRPLARQASAERSRQKEHYMDFADSPEQAIFRKEVEQFFDDNFPEELVADPNIDPRTEGRRPDGGEALKRWRAALVEKGWIAPAWPKQYGGADLSPMEQFILNETVAKRGAPMVRVPDVGS